MGWVALDTDTIMGVLGEYVALFETWHAVADLMMPYERMRSAPEAQLARLASSMGLRFEMSDAAIVPQRLSALPPSIDRPAGTNANFDRQTLLHDGHLGSGDDEAAAALLQRSLATRIETVFADWLSARGYR